MKVLYIDCGMGAAGDMLTAALLEASGRKEELTRKLNELGIPGVTYNLESAVKCGITGSHMSVLVNGEEEHEAMHAIEHAHGHEHHHEHDHEHEHHHEHDHEHHHHHHASMHAIEHIVWDLHLPKKVEEDVLAVYQLIAEAESQVHGVPVTEIHFHEVGTMDAVADVAAVCLLMNEIAPDKVIASPIHVGSGTVHCAHGVLPVPAPATALILKGLPIYSREDIKGELCTPTGAALLKHFVNEFRPMPAMITENIGYGMGKKDFPIANCVRVFVGKTPESPEQSGEPQSISRPAGDGAVAVQEGKVYIPAGKDESDVVLELSCNVDDMTAEEIGFAMEQLFAGGAHEVYTMAIGMKKSRPGIKISVICPPVVKEKMVELLFKHTTTIGVREAVTFRNVMRRTMSTVETPYGPVTKKVVAGYGVERAKFEFEDLAQIAREKGLSLREVRALVEKAISEE